MAFWSMSWHSHPPIHRNIVCKNEIIRYLLHTLISPSWTATNNNKTLRQIHFFASLFIFSLRWLRSAKYARFDCIISYFFWLIFYFEMHSANITSITIYRLMHFNMSSAQSNCIQRVFPDFFLFKLLCYYALLVKRTFRTICRKYFGD